MISFSHVINNIVHVYQRDLPHLDVKRVIQIDLNGIDTMDFTNKFTGKEVGDIKIWFRGNRAMADEINYKRRRCIKCDTKSDTTYCKQCWSEIG